MNPCQTLPPIEDLIPHRGSMLLLDRVVDFDAESACAEYTPQADAWYVNEAGNMPAWFGIELMAQTVAAQVGLLKRDQGLPHKQGVLLGTRRYASSRPSFQANCRLRIHVRVIMCDTSGLGAYECHIETDNEEIASATLKVFEPDNFQTFLHASEP